MKPQSAKVGKQYMLYDADSVGDVSPRLFDPAWYERTSASRGIAVGRGTTHFVTLDGRAAVLRHYRRGGFIARFNEDRYLFTGVTRSRAWREWHLLATLREFQLPVPAPLAARIERIGPWYRADLLTCEIAAARPLSKRLVEAPLSEMTWRAVGATVCRFHVKGVYHADLNAHNILLDDAGRVFLIDFDRGAIRADSHAWRQSNLARLQRSLTKLHGLHQPFHYGEPEWACLLQGYERG